jgi:crossover junction endodeoxyribonuclease RuvC
MPVFEYAPRKIKLSITGKGAASKEQVAALLTNILKTKDVPDFLDATDGLAVALCHYYESQRQIKSGSSGKGWDAFIKANPDRIK